MSKWFMGRKEREAQKKDRELSAKIREDTARQRALTPAIVAQMKILDKVREENHIVEGLRRAGLSRG